MSERARVSPFVPLAAAVLVSACTTPTLPEESDAVFSATLPAHVEAGADLRYAILWLEGTRVRVTNGGRVRGASFDARFAWPSGIRSGELQPIEKVLVASGEFPLSGSGQIFAPFSVYADSYRPRVVLYRDLDADRALTLDPASADTMLATDSSTGVAALLDVEATLAKLTLNQSREFYADGQEYSRFVMVSGSGLSLQIVESASIFLYAGPHAELREEIQCARSVATTRAAMETRVLVDESLDPALACPRGVSACSGASLEGLEQPDYESDRDVQRYAQCRRSAELAALSIFAVQPDCADCVCIEEPLVELYLTSRDAAPSWWPCGDEIEYCDDGLDVAATAYCSAPYGLEANENPSSSDAGTDAGL